MLCAYPGCEYHIEQYQTKYCCEGHRQGHRADKAEKLVDELYKALYDVLGNCIDDTKSRSQFVRTGQAVLAKVPRSS